MALEEFHCVVVGDEPAGLWLLQRLAATAPELLAEGKLAWVRFERTLEPVAVPVGLAAPFALPLSDPWSAELVTPSQSLAWRTDTLAARFPELPPRFSEPLQLLPEPRLSSAQMSAVRFSIRQHPELLTYATALWKYLGRTQRLQPETLVAQSLLCTRLGWWAPDKALPDGVRYLEVTPRQHGVEELRLLKSGLVSIRFEGKEPLFSRHWVLNCPWHRVLALSRHSHELVDALNVADELRSPLALAALRLTVDAAAVPAGASPLTLRLATDDIPDPAREMWPVELRAGASPGTRNVALWASVPRDLPLEATLETFRRGLGELSRLFPFLAESIVEQSVPLGMDTCFTDEQRAGALDTLEATLVESHDFTALQTQTRVPGLHTLFPSLHCNLPFPIGPLYAAQRILQDIVGKKRLQTPRPSAPPPEASQTGTV